jgi:cytochrome c553
MFNNLGEAMEYCEKFGLKVDPRNAFATAAALQRAVAAGQESAQQSVQRTAGGLCPNCHEPKAAHVGAHRLCPNGKWNNYGRDTRRR